MPTFTLASFNICSAHFREGHYTEENLNSIAEHILACGADVVCLQEVDKGATRSDRVDMTAYLAEKTSLSHSHFIKIRDFQGGEYGTAILSRYPITESRTINYAVRIATQGTSCGYAVLDVEGTPVTVFNTHQVYMGADKLLEDAVKLFERHRDTVHRKIASSLAGNDGRIAGLAEMLEERFKTPL